MPHTPGPWHIDLETPMTLGGDCRSVEALTPDGKMVTREVANLMFDTDEWPNGEGWLEDAANANLIAAAPDMLAALEGAEAAFVNCVPIRPYAGDGPLVMIRAAIAKAKGIKA